MECTRGLAACKVPHPFGFNFLPTDLSGAYISMDRCACERLGLSFQLIQVPRSGNLKPGGTPALPGDCPAPSWDPRPGAPAPRRAVPGVAQQAAPEPELRIFGGIGLDP